MVCPNCGFNNKNGLKNCLNCGYLLVEVKTIHINYVMLVGGIIGAILVGELAYLLGGFYRTYIESKKIVVTDEIEVVYAKNNMDINTVLSDEDVIFKKIPKDIYKDSMITKEEYQSGLCVNSNLIKDTFIYKEELVLCNSNNTDSLEENLNEIELDNNNYGFKKDNYVDLYLSLVDDGKLIFDKIIEGLKVRRVNENKIVLAIPKEYDCLIKNAQSLGGEFTLNVSHVKISNIIDNKLKEILEAKGCLDE